MQTTVNQYKAEEDVLTSNLVKAGLSSDEIVFHLGFIKSKDPLKKADRNIYIKKIAKILGSRACALQMWYVFEILSKVTGLAPSYISRIAWDPNPQNIIKSSTEQ